MSLFGLPLQSAPRPATRPLSRRALPLEGTLTATNGPAAFRAQLAAWGFEELPLQPTRDPESRVWGHPAGVWLLGHGLPQENIRNVGWRLNAVTVLATLDLGHYHTDREVENVVKPKDCLEFEATLRHPATGRALMAVRAMCAPERLAGVLRRLQTHGRLAPFSAMKEAGQLSPTGLRTVFHRDAVNTWDLAACGALPPDARDVLGWIKAYAPTDDDKINRARDSGALQTLLRNHAKALRRRWLSDDDGARRDRWARAASGDAPRTDPCFDVLEGGLTQAACLACVPTMPGNLPALSAWVREAPFEALEAAVMGNPPSVPPLPLLALHQVAKMGVWQEWTEACEELPRLFDALLDRLGPQGLAHAWEAHGGTPWDTLLPRGQGGWQVEEGPAVASIQALIACERGGCAWPSPRASQQEALDAWPDDAVGLLNAFRGEQRLEAAVGAAAKPSARPRM